MRCYQEFRDEFDQPMADRIVLHAAEQRVADFQIVRLQLGHRFQRCVTGAAVVDGDFEAHRFQMVQGMAKGSVIANGAPLGHFDDHLLMTVEEGVKDIAASLLELLDEMRLEIKEKIPARADIGKHGANIFNT